VAQELGVIPILVACALDFNLRNSFNMGVMLFGKRASATQIGMSCCSCCGFSAMFMARAAYRYPYLIPILVACALDCDPLNSLNMGVMFFSKRASAAQISISAIPLGIGIRTSCARFILISD